MKFSKLGDNSFPVDPAVMNRPIRFNLTVETDNSKTFLQPRTFLQIDRSSPIVQCKQTKS